MKYQLHKSGLSFEEYVFSFPPPLDLYRRMFGLRFSLSISFPIFLTLNLFPFPPLPFSPSPSHPHHWCSIQIPCHRFNQFLRVADYWSFMLLKFTV